MHDNSLKLVVSTAYFPPVEYLAAVSRYNQVYIERHENYNKQSYRNRCNILTANGVQSLVVPVIRFRNNKTPVKDVKPDNSCNWQKNHFLSIESAYRSAPFYEFYIDDIRPFFTEKYTYLLDLNTDILHTMLSLTGLTSKVEYTDCYQFELPSDTIDIRDRIHPKKKDQVKHMALNYPVYPQVFNYKYPFQPDLSVLDLLFNTGPDAGKLIKTGNLQ